MAGVGLLRQRVTDRDRRQPRLGPHEQLHKLPVTAALISEPGSFTDCTE